MEKILYGVGNNNADYKITRTQMVDGKRKIVWRCPFYVKWHSMLQRCYSERCHQLQPTYKDCSVVEEWFKFMSFRAWMIKQDWEDKELDKDLLFPGNKVYGPEACVFVTRSTNVIMVDAGASRGEFPIGVHLHKPTGKYKAQCTNRGRVVHLGLFYCPNEAHLSWCKYKAGVIRTESLEQTDDRVKAALIKRADALMEKCK